MGENMNKTVGNFWWEILLVTLFITSGCQTVSNTPSPEEMPTSVVMADCIWNKEVLAWVDNNRNGKRDAGDQPLENVKFQVNDPLNQLENVAEPAVSYGDGRATLSVWLPGCPETSFEVIATPPSGYRIITNNVIKINESVAAEGYTLEFGFALIEGYPSPTPYVAGLRCYPQPQSAADFAVDSSGIVWLVGASGTAEYVRTNGSWRSYPPETYLDHIYVGKNGTVWVNGYGLDAAKLDNGQWTYFSKESDLIAQSMPNIGVTPDGFIWFSPNDWDTFLTGFNPTTNEWKLLDTKNAWNKPMPAWVFTDGEVWRVAFGNTSQVKVPDPQPAGWKFYSKHTFSDAETIENPIVGGSISGVDIDPDGKIWIASEMAFAMYDSLSNTWIVFDDATLKNEFVTGSIVDLTTSPDGSVWIALSGKNPTIVRFTPDTSNLALGKWRKFDIRDGIPNLRDITTLEFDQQGDLWIGYDYQSTIAQCVVIAP
jgi:hypothetical protein